MTKAELLAIVKADHNQQEAFYVKYGPRKQTQEEHYVEGVAVVRMNYHLLVDWLDMWDEEHPHSGEGAGSGLAAQPKADRREIWEASAFHYGIYGYGPHDADFWWEHNAT